MQIASIQIKNYKSFLSSDEIQLSAGFNVIVGKNNTGKTALVEAISLRQGDKPHRSELTIPYSGAMPDQISQVDITFKISRSELVNILLDNIPHFYAPQSIGPSSDDPASIFEDYINDVNTIICTFRENQFTSAYLETIGNKRADKTFQFEIKRPNKRPVHVPGNYSEQIFTYPLANILKERIYLFKAERLNVGQSNFGGDSVLQPDASNLPSHLIYLMNNRPALFDRLTEAVREIFPDVKYIRVPNLPNNPSMSRISIGPTDYNIRDDLGIPLQECGTGIGQVLAMLSVVLTSDYPRTIIIDEPQSFLHPGAIRKLFDIFKQHPQHQYITTTHSPTVITAANPQTLLLIKKEGAESVIETVNVADTQSLRGYLTEIGARLSDVFGADDILWVEGPTEERCYPLIAERLLHRPLMGTAIIGVKHTDDFKRKNKQLKDLILDIYRRLCKGRGLLPPAVGFLFDREELTDQDIDDLSRASRDSEGNETMFFIPRRMYENYLLHPGAIAALMTSIENFRDDPVSAQEVEDWLEQNRWDRAYMGREFSDAEKTDSLWREKVDGTAILRAMFTEFSEGRVAYDDKPGYGQALTEWLIEHAPEELADIKDRLQQILARSNQP